MIVNVEHKALFVPGRGWCIAGFDDEFQEWMRVSEEFFRTLFEAGQAFLSGNWTPA